MELESCADQESIGNDGPPTKWQAEATSKLKSARLHVPQKVAYDISTYLKNHFSETYNYINLI